MNDYKDNLIYYRLKKKFTHRDMAQALGITHVAYANIENGKTKSLSLQNAAAIAEKLEVDFYELFGVNSKKDTTELLKLNEDVLKIYSYYKMFLEMFSNNLITMKEQLLSKDKISKEEIIDKFDLIIRSIESFNSTVREGNKTVESLLAENKKSNL